MHSHRLPATIQILRRFSRLPHALQGGAFAIGNFDGVHLGHQEVIAAAARSGARPLGVLLFAPHPRLYFRPDEPLAGLTSLRARLCLLARLGVEVAVVAPFDAKMANRSAAAFVDEVLVRQLAARHLAVGYDFAFGHKREGDAALLQRLGQEAGMSVSVAAPVSRRGAACSSTRIRAALAQGDMDLAADLLGHRWGVEGIVVAGDGRGRALGFATANLPVHEMDCVFASGGANRRKRVYSRQGGEFTLPFGIYAAWVLVQATRKQAGTWHPAAVSVGWRPTFESKEPILEAHLLDFDADIYGRRLWVFPVAFLRREEKFASVADLQRQMRADCQQARRRLDAAPPPFALP